MKIMTIIKKINMELGEVKNIQRKISEIPRLKQLIFKQKYLCIFWDLSGKLRKIQMHVNPTPNFLGLEWHI